MIQESGCSILEELPQLSSESQIIRIRLLCWILSSIIAIHGLNGHPIESWTAGKKSSGVLWLRDLLPTLIPSARILSYGYSAFDDVRGKVTEYSIYEIARNMLAHIAAERKASNVCYL